MIILAMLYSLALALIVIMGLLSAFLIKISYKEFKTWDGWLGVHLGIIGIMFSIYYVAQVIMFIKDL